LLFRESPERILRLHLLVQPVALGYILLPLNCLVACPAQLVFFGFLPFGSDYTNYNCSQKRKGC